MLVCSTWTDAVTAMGQAVAAVASVIAIVVAFKSARKMHQIEIAPERVTQYHVFSLLIDHLANSVENVPSKDVFTKEDIRDVVDRWLRAVEKDERFSALVRQGVLSSTKLGYSIDTYREMRDKVCSVLADVPFYFDKATSDKVNQFLAFWMRLEPCVPSPVEEMDKEKALPATEMCVCGDISDVLMASQEALNRMQKELLIGR